MSPTPESAARRLGDYAPTISATFEDEPISAPAGASVAAALLSADRTAWRTTRAGRQRGLFCGIGICFDCIVEIDGESGQRACMIPLADGMDIRGARSAAAPHCAEVSPTGCGPDAGMDADSTTAEEDAR